MSHLLRKYKAIIKNKSLHQIIEDKVKHFSVFSKTSRRIQALEYQVNGLYELLNYISDISLANKAKGELRKLQNADVFLLQLFDRVCKKNNLTYWIDYGTLLGAVRHKGFIPWDDDLDIGMIRDDYNRCKVILENELGKYGFSINEGVGYTAQVIRVVFGDTPIQLDIWPYDCSHTITDWQEIGKVIVNENKAFFNTFLWEELYYGVYPFPRDKLSERIRELGFNQADFESSKIMFSGFEALPLGKPEIHSTKDILPTSFLEFENMMFPVPNNSDKHLSEIYGDYLKYPKFKVLGHDDINERQTRSNLDYEVELKKIINIFPY